MGVFPDSAEITSMRSAMQALFSDTCDISRDSTGADPYGGETPTPNVIATDVPCDVYPQVQALRPVEVIGSQVEVRMLWNISLPVGTDVKVGDKLTINSTGRETVVQSVLAPESLDLELRVVASIEGEPYV